MSEREFFNGDDAGRSSDCSHVTSMHKLEYPVPRIKGKGPVQLKDELAVFRPLSLPV